MKRLKIGFTLFFIFSSLIFSCDRYGDCGKIKPHFEILGLKSANKKFTETNIPSNIEIHEPESINWEKFFIEIEFDVDFYGSVKEKIRGGANLYALDCMPNGYNGSKVGVDTLYIVALDNYNQKFKANDIINNIILVNYEIFYPEDFQKFVSLSQYIKDNKEKIYSGKLSIKFTEAPQLSQSNQRFKIIYHLSDGKVFEATTKGVNLSK